MSATSNVVELSLSREAAMRIEGGYQEEWSRYYGASRRLVDREAAIGLADAHVAYLKKRAAEILADRKAQR